MIKYIEGDLLKTDCKIIVHGCNAQGIMGSGIAKAIRAEHPKAYKVYREYYEVCGLNLGECITVFSSGLYVVNMITQDFYGRQNKRYASYDAIADGCVALTKIVNDLGEDTVALPKIGCGLGGGKWSVVENILESYLMVPNILVYELNTKEEVLKTS